MKFADAELASIVLTTISNTNQELDFLQTALLELENYGNIRIKELLKNYLSHLLSKIFVEPNITIKKFKEVLGSITLI